MDGELVSSEPENENGERSKPLPSYSKTFEDLCGWYLSIGMSYGDYWDGDPAIAKHYREKNRCDMERMNTQLWLQGAYIYEAILDTVPAFNILSKKREPTPYRESPMPLTKQAQDRRKADENQRKMEAGKAAMEALMVKVNAEIRKKKEKTNNEQSDI